MFVVETIIAVGSLACALPSRRTEGASPLECFSSADTARTYQLSTGVSLESSVKTDLEKIPGVRTVDITREGNEYTVNVVLDELEFPVFEQVVAKELELFDNHSDKKFKFQVMAANRDSSSSLINAA